MAGRVFFWSEKCSARVQLVMDTLIGCFGVEINCNGLVKESLSVDGV